MATIVVKEEVDNVRVAVRCRPMTPKEIENDCKTIVNVNQTRGDIIVNIPNPKATREPTRTFTFDLVFGPESTQAEIYNETARPIVDAVLEGYNGTIFAYGQTGTGKTFTMAGDRSVPELRGIIPNSFAHLFGVIAKSEGATQFLVRVSYLEIYNEGVRDLLSKNTKAKLEVRERSDIGVYVKDLTSFVVKNVDEMLKLMLVGSKNRAEGRTDMNEHSSRSHTIFTVTVEQSVIGPDKKSHVKMGKLHMVDLAGSERLSKTGSEGVRRDEGASINRSLFNLGLVISALVDGKSKFIPYRNSKLTLLLQDSLGGNSKTLMIANIGPADYNSDETLNTLRYANGAKKIQNKAHINEDPKDAMLREFQKEIERLRKNLEDDEFSEDDESEEDVHENGKKRRKKKVKDSLSRTMSPKAMAELRAQIDKERVELRASKNMAEGERDKAQNELEMKEKELKKAQVEQAELEKRLKDLESKVIVGGINLLDEAEQQEKLLERSRKELQKRKKKEAALKEQLKEKEAKRLDYKNKIASLQETSQDVTKQLKDTWKQLQNAKDELLAVREECEHENAALLSNIRQLNREMGLYTLIMDSYIPQEYQELIQHHALWDEETQEWHLHAIAYTGNNMRRKELPDPPKPLVHWDTTSVYLTYSSSEHEGPGFGIEQSYSSSSGSRSKVMKSSKSSTSTKSVTKRKTSTTSLSSDQSIDDSEFPTIRGLVSRQKHFA